MNFEDHPCFNAKARHRTGRVHLPVAPRCNIQCKFCNRLFDCVGESRPGVTSTLLTPEQALIYLEKVLKIKPEIRVVGIAGPGDPFANPAETLATLREVRKRHPGLLLCLASNGLNLSPYLEDLARIQVSHVTLTVNAVDPAIGRRIYAWVRHGPRVRRAAEGAEILLEKQLEAIRGLKRLEMIVKVNAIVLPGINDGHIPAVAREMAALGVDLFNCVPYHPCKGSAFEGMAEPGPERVRAIREAAGAFLPQMLHCTRCRSDAAGLLGEPLSREILQNLRECGRLPAGAPSPSGRARVAVASREGVLVNQHLGQAERLFIYAHEAGRAVLEDTRPAPAKGGGPARWQALADTLADCRALLVSGIGDTPRTILADQGIAIYEVEGVIAEAVKAVFDGREIRRYLKPGPAAGRQACGGAGLGCG